MPDWIAIAEKTLEQEEKSSKGTDWIALAEEQLRQEDQSVLKYLNEWAGKGVDPNLIVDEARNKGLLNPSTINEVRKIVGGVVDVTAPDRAYLETFGREMNEATGVGAIDTLGAGVYHGLAGVSSIALRGSDVLTGRQDADNLNMTLDAISSDAARRGKWRQYTQGAVSNISQMAALGHFGKALGAIGKLSSKAKYIPYAGMAAVVANQSYTTGINSGLSKKEAALYAAGQGAAEFTFNAIFHGLSRLSPKMNWIAGTEDTILNPEIFRESIKKGLGSAAKTFGKSSLAELTEEELVSFTQASIDRLSGVNPNELTAEDMSSIFFDTAGQVLLTGTAAHGINAGMNLSAVRQALESDAGDLNLNSQAIKELMQKETPSRRDFAKAGLPSMNAEERKNLVAEIRQMHEGMKKNTEEAKPDLVEGKQERINIGEIPGGLSPKYLHEYGQRKEDILDSLTGVIKSDIIRRQMQEHETDENAALLYLDIDDFKAVNEIFGHAEGDSILSKFGNVINKHFGGKESAHAPGRAGGEEFVVKVDMRDQDLQEKLKSFIDDVQNVLVNDEEPITVSGGLARGGEIGKSGKYDAIADKLLGEAKKEGKNRIKFDLGGETGYIIGEEYWSKKYVNRLDERELYSRAKRLLRESSVLPSEVRDSLTRTVQAFEKWESEKQLQSRKSEEAGLGGGTGSEPKGESGLYKETKGRVNEQGSTAGQTGIAPLEGQAGEIAGGLGQDEGGDRNGERGEAGGDGSPGTEEQSQLEDDDDIDKGPRIPGGNAMAALSEEDSFKQTEEQEPTTPETNPKIRRIADKTPVKDAIKGVIEIMSPAHVDNVSRKAGHIFREEMAASAQREEVVKAALAKHELKFEKMSPEESYDFIDKMESGQKQNSPELEEISTALREQLDSAREEVQKIGKLKEYIENYFPHIWEHPDEAKGVITSVMSRKAFKSGGFLKQRKYMTFKDGLEAGLKPVTDNPVEMTIRRIHEMNKYVARTRMFERVKQSGMLKFVPSSLEGKTFMPAGYEHINDPSFTVATSPDVTVSEAYDKLLVDQLAAVANRLGVNHERVAKIARKANSWGTSLPGKNIKTRFAGTESIFAHEIGHQIGEIYDLHDYLTREHENHKKIKEELESLADLRVEGIKNIPSNFQRYIRKKAEKEAVILEAWLAAPEKMEKVAPELTKAWVEFLEQNEPLQPLLSLNRSVVLGTRAQQIEQPGVRVLGRWAMPREVATMINNILSPGLRGSKNAAVKGTYRLARFAGNAMNQASLSLSMFHAFNVMTDAASSQLGLGLQQLTKGNFQKSAANIATSPIAGFQALSKGDELIKAMRTDLSQIDNPRLKEMVETIIKAGGRASMDTMYHNHAVKEIFRSLRDIKFGDTSQKISGTVKLPVQAIFAGLELTTKPIMEWMVPRLKLGVFYKMAEDVYSRAGKEGLNDFQITEQLTQAWDSVDNRMGQLAYDNLFWNQYLKDASMLAVRSVGWNLGSWREFVGAGVDIATTKQRLERGDQILSRKMAYTVGAVITYSTLGTIIQYMFTGEPPEELKDYFFPKTGRKNYDGSDERLSLPIYAKDWVAWSTDPVKAASHKLHPMWATISEMVSNKDYYGTKIRNEDDPIIQQMTDTLSHAAESFIPFSVKNFFRMRDAGESEPLAMTMAFSGISSAPGYIAKTPAQKLAAQFLSDRMPRGSRTKGKAEAAERRWELIKKLRSGLKLKEKDKEGFTVSQIKSIEKAAKFTPFQSQFKRLTFEEALNVFNAANTKERSQVFDILLDKRVKARHPGEDAIRMFNELELTQEQIDKGLKTEKAAIAKELYLLTNPKLRNEEIEERIEVLSKSKYFDPSPEKILRSFQAEALRRGLKANIYTSSGKLTSYGERYQKLMRIINQR